jgi:signal transduction histidine kinase
MGDDRHERKKRRHARRRRSRSVRDDIGRGGVDPELLSPEERALHEAHLQAERKVELTGDLIKFGVIALPLLLFLPPVGIVVLIIWGPRHARSFYELVLEPRMRERFLREEVEKRVHAQLSRERRELEGEHARSMQELSASIAHEIRNPITAAKSLVQQMEEDPAAVDNVEYARVALEELSRVERSVSHLLRFARDEEMRVADVRLADVVDSALETFRDRVERSGIRLERNLASEGAIRGDAEKLRRVVINLVGNALDAVDEAGGSAGRVDVEIGENLAATQVWLRIADDGPGIDEEARDKLFSPFHTSKENGTGLGLPICKKLVEAHGGSMEVHSEPGRGTEFLVTFPKRSPGEGGVS